MSPFHLNHEAAAVTAFLASRPRKKASFFFIFRLVHAITPMEETKSFLEKVQLGGKLCGIDRDDAFFEKFLPNGESLARRPFQNHSLKLSEDFVKTKI